MGYAWLAWRFSWFTHGAVSLACGICEKLMRGAEKVGELALPEVVALFEVLALSFRTRGLFFC